jgi:hypothetical protein
MPGLRASVIIFFLVGALACGSRTGLDTLAGSAAAAPDGGGLLPDGGDGLPDVPFVPSSVCHSWVPTHAPVQVSDIPSIVEVLSAIPTPSGVLVAYADAQVPPVDLGWHDRLVSFGDGALGSEQTPFVRENPEEDWTALWLALGNGTGAASASNQGVGMQFVPIDTSGVSMGSVTTVPGEAGRYLLPTSTGFSILRSPFNSSGMRPPPVSLAMLGPSGSVLSETTLLEASTKTDWYWRIGFPDGSFLLLWESETDPSGSSVVFGRHFAEGGTSLAPSVTLHTFGPDSVGYAVAASSSGFLGVWSEATGDSTGLVAEPFDEDGHSTGPSSPFGNASGNIIALATAPGGDLLAAWDGASESAGTVYVQAVSADGTPEGTPTMLGSIMSPEQDLFVVASPLGGMVLYENDTPSNVEVGVPLRCAE